MFKKVLILITGDIFAAFLALALAHYLLFGVLPGADAFNEYHAISVIVLIFTTLFSSFLLEIYHLNRFLAGKESAVRIFISIIFSFFILSGFYRLMPLYMFGGWMLVLTLVFFGSLQLAWHYLCYLIFQVLCLCQKGSDPRQRSIGQTDRQPYYCGQSELCAFGLCGLHQ